MEILTKEKHYRYIGIKRHYVRKIEMKITQEELSEMTGISKDTISNIERGVFLPNIKTMLELSRATEKSVDYFLTPRINNL